ncbi:MAG TPA: AsmA-like C-terminal domain-containing protein [Stellaceae bacterium]|nr:AsmA-like C-terminal domain-containing protein [Stellaceae bacterium]
METARPSPAGQGQADAGGPRKRRRVRRVLRWLGVLTAVAALLIAVFVWRLSKGPVALDFLGPYVADVIASSQPGLAAHIDHTLVSLEQGGTVDIVARGVRLRRRDGEAQLTLPELSLGLSLRAALRGVIAPTRIVLRQPDLRLERATDGTFHIGLGEDEPSAGDWADNLLHDLAAPPDRHGRLGYLAQVAVRDAGLTVDDRALGVTWRAKRADASIFRTDDGIFGDVAVTVERAGGGETQLHSDFRYIGGQDRLAIQLAFSDLRPALFAGAAPALAPLAAVDLPLSGQVRLELDTAALRISDAWCDVSLAAGRLVHPAFQEGAVPVTSGQLRIAYDPAQGRATVEELSVDLGGPQFRGTATIDGLGDGLLAGGSAVTAFDVAADLKLSEVSLERLPTLWPGRLGPKARSWVLEHVHDGVAADATAQLAAHIDLAPDAARPARLDSIAGTLDYRGLTVEYFKGLPPLRGVDGTATFDRAHFDLVPTAGTVNGVQLTGGTAKLSKLDTNDEEIALDLGLRGDLAAVLQVLDSDPLHYARALKIDPAQLTGKVDGHVLFNFPLKHDLTIAEVDYGAQATLSGVGVPHAVAGADLTGGDLKLQLDRSSLRIGGTARLADVPASLSWVESLRRGDAVQTRYTLKARLDDAARRRLDVDFLPDVVKGPVDVDVDYALMATKRATADVALDLRDATLDVAKLNWRKAPGVPATATLSVDLADDHVRAIRDATLKGAGADARVSLAFGDGGSIRRVDAPRLILGETDASGSIAPRKEGGWQVELRGMSFDATGLMADLGQSAGTEASLPLVIDAAVDRLILGPKREARAVKGQVYSDGVHWQAASLDATLFGGGKASLRFGEAGGARNFRLSSGDFGGLVRVLGLSDNVTGGEIEITGRADDKGARRVFSGKVDGRNYRIVNAPLFAKLLSVASFSGIGGLLSGEGIPFTHLTGEFAIADGKLEFKEARAYGGAIGVNASGSLDMLLNLLEVSGTLVPAYSINSVLGNLPVLGPILLGGEGEGIFGANFKIAGPASDPKITVNPLSALAPGLLRKLFLFDAPQPAATPSPAGPGPAQ